MNARDADAANRWLDDFARTSSSEQSLDRLVAVVTDRIVSAVPEFGDPALRPGLNASVRGNWTGFLAVVSHERIEVHSPPQVRDWARTLARRDVELPVLLSSYRIAQRATWDFINEFLNEQVADPELRSAVLVKFWSHASEWMDTTVEKLVELFTEEQRQWQRSAVARRSAIVKALLAGRADDIEGMSADLAYPLTQQHTAFTVHLDSVVPESETLRTLESAARAVSRWLGGGGPLIVPTDARSAWGWTATTQPVAVPGTTPPAIPRGARVTVGNCHPGVSGFRISHSEAVAVVSVANPDAVVTRFSDGELACLVAGTLDAEARSAFVVRELGGLADAGEISQRLRDSLRAYLASGCDAVTTAEQLALHPNGVRYRIRQAEKLIGHPLNLRRGHLEVALEIIGVFGVPPAG